MRGLGLALVSLGLNLSLGFSATYYVSPTGSNTDPCTQAQPCDFQTALDNAATDGQDSTIIVAPGTYNVSSTLTYSVADGDGKLTIQAQDPNNKPVLDGGNNVRIMELNNDNNIDKLGDLNEDIVVKNILFQNGKSALTSGLYVRTGQSNITIDGCEFRNNSSSSGSTLYIKTDSGNITLNKCKFIENEGSNGAGANILQNSGNVFITNSFFSKNTASSSGGGAFISSAGIVVIANNYFLNNNAGNAPVEGIVTGGGISVGGNYIHLVNNTFYGNVSNYGVGGGVAIDVRTLVDIFNNIFWNNTANSGDGDDLFAISFISNSTINIFNNNFGPNSDFTSGQSEDFVVANVSNYVHGNNITLDPLFVDIVNGDFHLSPNSPLIDKGENNAPYLPTVDFEGNNRIMDGDNDGNSAVDIGADEYDPNNGLPVISTFIANPDFGYVPLNVSFIWNVSDPNGDTLTCYLDIDNDGNTDYIIKGCSNNTSQQHTYSIADNYIAKLTVNDGRGGVASKTINITATVNPIVQYHLTIDKAGTGRGGVTSNPTGIDCGSSCSAKFQAGSTVVLTATPSQGSVFSGWGGDCSSCGTNTACSVTLNADLNCSAQFDINQPPQINSFTASPSSGTAPLTVNFTCDAVDPDGSVTEYRWDFEGDGQINTITATNTATFTYNSGGTYTAKCTAVDNLGATAEATVSITVSSVTSGGGTGGGASSSGGGGCSSTPSGSPYLALLILLFMRSAYRLLHGRLSFRL